MRDFAGQLALALQRNPRVGRARAQARASGLRIPQVTSLDDPMLSVVPPTGDLAETAAGEVSATVGVSQKIPFPVKLLVRGKAATQEARMAFERYRAAVLETAAEVRRAYYMVYFADRAIEIETESRGLLRDFRSIAARKYESGRVPQQDVLRAQVELANIENEIVRLREVRGTAAARLNRLMSRHPTTAIPVTPEIEQRRVRLALNELLARAEDANPDIAAARAAIERAKAGLTLAKLNYVPDLTLGYAHTFVSGSGLSRVATGDDTDAFTIGVNLPIWFERLSAATREARQELVASEQGLTDARDTTAFRIREVLLKIDTQQTLIELFSGVIIPEARQTLDATVAAYKAGQVDFLTLIENWRRLLDFQVAYQTSLSTFEQEIAELERLVGAPIEESKNGS